MTSRSAEAYRPVDATPSALKRQLVDHSIVWVGAGASIPAGYPSAGKLVELMKDASDDPIEGDEFPAVADQFVRSRGPGALRMLLQRALGTPGPLLPFHRALAALARSKHVHTIITTNYDDLVERALSEAGVPHIVQTFERNFDAVSLPTVRVLKVHGSQQDWGTIVLSGSSYERFQRDYALMNKQLDVLCTQHPMTFVGASLCEPRVLAWLAGQSPEDRHRMLPWRAFLTSDEWSRLLEFELPGIRARDVLIGQFRPLILDSHQDIPRIWSEVASELSPDTKSHSLIPSPPRLEFDWPYADPPQAELHAFLSEAGYRSALGQVPCCRVDLLPLTATEKALAELDAGQPLTHEARKQRVQFLQTIDYLLVKRNLLEKALELVVSDDRRKQAGWWLLPDENMPVVVYEMMRDAKLAGSIRALLINHEDQLQGRLYFSPSELRPIVGGELRERDFLSIVDFPLPRDVAELDWHAQYRALGAILRTLIERGLDPIENLSLVNKRKWVLSGD